MKKEEIDDILLTVRDLRMAVHMKEEIDAGVERGLANFADGEKISIPIPEATKGKLNSKIKELTGLLKAKVAALGG